MLSLSGCMSVEDGTDSAESAPELSRKEQYLQAFKRPAAPIRMSQLGVRLNQPIIAVFESDSDAPITWQLKRDSEVVETGVSQPFGIDPGSNVPVHIVRASPQTRMNTQLYLDVEGVGKSRTFRVGDDIYHQLKYATLNYFYHNRAGTEILASYAGGEEWARPAGHANEIVTCFEGKDRHGVYWPGCDYSLDVTGGWYDAGDQSKYVVNSGISVWTLQNQYERGARGFEDGAVRIPENNNGINDLLDEARWNLDFMLSMQAPEGAQAPIVRGNYAGRLSSMKVEIADVSGMAHHKAGDARWPGFPVAPHENDIERVLHAPSVTATLNLAAVAAQCARIYQSIDPVYSDKCRVAATRAYAAAKRLPDVYAYNNFDGSGPYESIDARSDFYWAAAEIYLMTGSEADKAELLARRSDLHMYPMPVWRDISWLDTQGLGTLALANFASDPTLKQESLVALQGLADAYLLEMNSQGYVIPFSRKEWQWGSVGALANRGMMLANVYDLTGDAQYRDGGYRLLEYIVGRNPRDVSYVSGMGEKSVEAVHHRFWAASISPDYPTPPPGAVSGGPNSSNAQGPVLQVIKSYCHVQTCFADHIDAYGMNEVAINWQAAVFWLATWADEVDRPEIKVAGLQAGWYSPEND